MQICHRNETIEQMVLTPAPSRLPNPSDRYRAAPYSALRCFPTAQPFFIYLY